MHAENSKNNNSTHHHRHPQKPSGEKQTDWPKRTKWSKMSKWSACLAGGQGLVKWPVITPLTTKDTNPKRRMVCVCVLRVMVIERSKLDRIDERLCESHQHRHKSRHQLMSTTVTTGIVSLFTAPKMSFVIWKIWNFTAAPSLCLCLSPSLSPSNDTTDQRKLIFWLFIILGPKWRCSDGGDSFEWGGFSVSVG